MLLQTYVMIVPKNFKTPRLDLREPRLMDADAIFNEYAQDDQIVRFLVWRPHSSVEETHAFVDACQEGWRTSAENTWAITAAGRDRAIGMISARKSGGTVELGYVLARKYWGQGMMAEAASAVMNWWLSQEGISRVQAYCDIENTASARVMEKIGMRSEGLVTGWAVHPNISEEPRDCLLYAKVRARELPR